MSAIGGISYPKFFTANAQFLPPLDLGCVKVSGETFFGQTSAQSEMLKVSQFFEAVRDECDFFAETVGVSGGYNETTEELGLNIEIELEASTTVQHAIWQVMSIMGEQFSLDESFYSNLAELEQVVLEGRVVTHFTIGAAEITPEHISTGDYGGIQPFVRFTRFEATASLRADEINLNFPVLLPVPGAPSVNAAQFSLDEGSLAIDFSVGLSGDQVPIEDFSVLDFFEYTGTLDASLPLSVEVGGNGNTFGLTVQLSADDLFTTPRPEVSYEVDTCSIRETVLALFGQLRDRLLEAVVELLVKQVNRINLPIEVGMIVEPLNSYVSKLVSDFTDTYIGEYLPSCSEINNPDQARHLEEVEDSTDDDSLVSVIGRAINATRDALESDGIHVTGGSELFFDGDLFVAGISTALGAVFDLNLTEVATFIETFFATVTDPDSSNDMSALGIGSGVGVSIDVGQLLDDTVIQAGFDLSFDITLDLGRMQASNLNDLGTALLEGFALTFNRWGAFASFTADPINVAFTAGSVNVDVTDSSFQVGVELESQDTFSASVKDMVDGRSDLSNLEPTFDIPLNIEVMFNIEVADFTLSPILAVTTDNILGNEPVDFMFDCNLNLFLDNSAAADDMDGRRRLEDSQSFGPGINLETVFQNITDLLDVVAEFGPEFQNAPSAVQGLFSVINQAKDFSNGLFEFKEFVHQVDELIPQDIRSVISHASELGSVLTLDSFWMTR